PRIVVEQEEQSSSKENTKSNHQDPHQKTAATQRHQQQQDRPVAVAGGQNARVAESDDDARRQENHVSTSAALEWTIESLRRSITHGPWRSLRCRSTSTTAPPGHAVLLVSRLLHLVDEFICLPAQVRVQLKENAQLFERIRRLVLESRRPSASGSNTAEDSEQQEDTDEEYQRKE
ncbi:Hypothetical protein, putative, partial [Bodo saltans]